MTASQTIPGLPALPYLSGAAQLWANLAGTDYRITVAQITGTGGPVFDIRGFGAQCDGVTDDTVAIQRAINTVGAGLLYFPNGLTSVVSKSLLMASGAYYFGGLTLFLANGANLPSPGGVPGGVMVGNAVSHVVVDGLQINANGGNQTSGGYGVVFYGGSYNAVRNAFIHDTFNAGVTAENEIGFRCIASEMQNCGRQISPGNPTDNHGILLASTIASQMTDTKIIGCTVTGAYRKGIASTALNGGQMNGLTIQGCYVDGCGLGGIYIGDAINPAPPSTPAAGPGLDFSIVGNTCVNNPVNIECDYITDSTVNDNICDTNPATSFTGNSGQYGIYISDSTNVTVNNNNVSSSQFDGIHIVGINATPSAIAAVGNTVTLSSQAGAGLGNGITLTGTSGSFGPTSCLVEANTILGEAVSPKQNVGVQENSPCNFNTVRNNIIRNTHSGSLVSLSGANSIYVNPLSQIDTALTLVNSGNPNVALPAGQGFHVIAGPTAGYAISGFVAGEPGEEHTVVNGVAQTLTVNLNSGSSTGGNRILFGGGSDLTISQFGAFTIRYSSTLSNWSLVSVKT